MLGHHKTLCRCIAPLRMSSALVTNYIANATAVNAVDIMVPFSDHFV